MRIWSIHPKYLDSQGLVALWREALLAQAVIRGQTQGYRHHPQLMRFTRQRAPVSAIGAYLKAVHQEACARSYAFDKSKIGSNRKVSPVPVTSGQMEYEWAHLLRKLALRSPPDYERVRTEPTPDCHPLFRLVAGDVESWERTDA
ncbi:MAG: pyrimidine dimer DNA glycosylase/endonuclease V [Burkholderiales bacterium]